MAEPQRYRKRPVVVEAMRLSAELDEPDDGLSPHDEAHAAVAGLMLSHGFRGFRVDGARRPVRARDRDARGRHARGAG